VLSFQKAGTRKRINRDKEESVGERHPFDRRCLRPAGPLPRPRRQHRSSSPRQSPPSRKVSSFRLTRSSTLPSAKTMMILAVTRKGPKTSLRRPPRDGTSCKRCQFDPPVALCGSQTNKRGRFGKKQNKQLRWTLHPTVRPHVARFKRRSLHTPNRCASVNNCEVAFCAHQYPNRLPIQYPAASRIAATNSLQTS
jgi:hypothetical protein